MPTYTVNEGVISRQRGEDYGTARVDFCPSFGERKSLHFAVLMLTPFWY